MKKNKISNWAALLLTVSGLAALPINLHATFTDTGTSTIRANAGSSGTASGAVYTIGNSDGFVFLAQGASTIFGDNVSLIATGSNTPIVIRVDGGSAVRLTNAAVENRVSGAALSVGNVGSVIDIDGATITTGAGYGVEIQAGSSVELHGGAVIKTGTNAIDGDANLGRNSAAIYANGAGASFHGTDMTIDMYGGYNYQAENYGSPGVWTQLGGVIDLGANTRITVHSTGTVRNGFGIYSQHLNSLITGTAVTVTTTGYAVAVGLGGKVVLVDSDLTGNQGGILVADNAGATNISEVIISSGTITAEHGNLIQLGENDEGSAPAVITISDATLNTVSGDLINNQANNCLSDITLDNVDAANAGGITINSNNSGTTNVNLNGGSGLTGDVTNSGNGTLTVNLNNSALTGDVTNAGDGILTIILDNNSIGTGGYHGGNLITGSDSAWTFNKDSHGNYGENNGVWNIGDYEVIFDNMTHSGTVNISVNSDTGDGGSITITGTADGEGTVHIDATGDGKADPNQVLPGKVTGDGTEHWQWDPIDWGIDTIIKDGDHFIKQGTSPAGAVLNSAIAIQQAMWFAQQNSLLKRMGELRYGARASRPPAGETPALHIIENIWLRSYGQQLNVGSQVAGKAYEQLIYGVDLGTDHKFTISADSDLYLGVYAGYGRSDLDYRTPDADGELNSYYGGFYATWLHSSGFYLDATFKAASVNNDLKAPYGTTQLTASYSDINLGGSIEIGNKFTFADDWFIEPQFQVNYLHILAENYSAAPLTISAQDLDALQLRIGSLFGRTINLTNSGAIQPYVKISGVETISTGGAIRNGYQSIRANTDGARAEVGGGIIWQLDANNQLHLDYEASFGDKYDKPWGLTAGYRHQF